MILIEYALIFSYFNQHSDITSKMSVKKIPLSQTSSLVLICDQGKSYQSPEVKKFLSRLDLSEGRKMYRKIEYLKPHLDEVIPNRKFLIHNHIRNILRQDRPPVQVPQDRVARPAQVGNILRQDRPPVQVLSLACGWDPVLLKMSREFPTHRFFGVDNESVQTQKRLIKEIAPRAQIFYIKANITDTKQMIKKLSKAGWKNHHPTLLLVEGISYYIPPKIFWTTLKTLKQHIKADCHVCGDFLIDWKKQKISPLSQKLAMMIFDMIKTVCSQEYYPYTVRQINQKLKYAGFSKIKFFTQSEIQKQRTGAIHPWKKEEGHIQLFTALAP